MHVSGILIATLQSGIDSSDLKFSTFDILCIVIKPIHLMILAAMGLSAGPLFLI